MKLTKKYLRKLIKEELKDILEQADGAEKFEVTVNILSKDGDGGMDKDWKTVTVSARNKEGAKEKALERVSGSTSIRSVKKLGSSHLDDPDYWKHQRTKIG